MNHKFRPKWKKRIDRINWILTELTELGSKFKSLRPVTEKAWMPKTVCLQCVRSHSIYWSRAVTIYIGASMEER